MLVQGWILQGGEVVVAVILLLLYKIKTQTLLRIVSLICAIILGLLLCTTILKSWNEWGVAKIVTVITIFIYIITTKKDGNFSIAFWFMLVVMIVSWVIPPLNWFYNFLFS